MAKKTLSAFDIIKKIDDSAMIVAENENAEVKEFIGTGSYILNACITGSILKGIPSGRMTVLSGDPGTGKTFVALSVCREAQKMGYTPIYLDSENAVDKDSMERLGIDTNKIILMNVNVITDVSNFMANLVVELDELKKKNKEEDIPKFLLVLDSLGNLTSSKEKEEMEKSGTPKRDMTKQQEIKAMFRVNTVGLARNNIPIIICSHVYSTQDLFSKKIVSGGSGLLYNASVILMFSMAKLDDKENTKAAEAEGLGKKDVVKTGVLVTVKPEKTRFCKPIKVQFQIPFFKRINKFVGLEQFLNWENAGIAQGRIYDEKELSKATKADKDIAEEFDFNGEKRYFVNRPTARKIAIKHLGAEIDPEDLWTETVFTPEFLKHIDDTIIRPLFELPSHFDDKADIEELLDDLNIDK